MINTAKKTFIAFALVSAFTLSAPSTAVFAKDKEQCASGEKWDKQQKRCVEASSY